MGFWGLLQDALLWQICCNSCYAKRVFQGKNFAVFPRPLSFQQFHNYNFGFRKVPFVLNVSSSEEPVNLPNITSLKTEALHTMHPYHTSEVRCTLMLLTSLVEPEWVLVNCSTKLLPWVFCQKMNFYRNQAVQHPPHLEQAYCPRNSIEYENICSCFVWFNDTDQKRNQEMSQNSLETFKASTRDFYTYIMEISLHFPPIISMAQGLQNFHMIVIQKYLHRPIFKTDNLSVKKAAGLIISKMEKISKKVFSLIHICSHSREHVSKLSLCDGLSDCETDGSDENQCSCSKTTRFCREIQHGKKKYCSDLYIMTKQGFCAKYFHSANVMRPKKLSHSSNQSNRETKSFLCINRNIPLVLVNDLIPDCGTGADDEPHVTALLKHGIEVMCAIPGQIVCKIGHSKCFNIFEICVFDLDMFGNLSPCRNGAHLENCRKIKCGTKYKCSVSHCVPWKYVCDGKWDCPEGDDETKEGACSTNRCVGKYKCKNSSQCDHLGILCDNHPDCPLADDEQLCDLERLPCSQECQCLVHAIKCVNYFPFPFLAEYPFQFVSLSNVIIPSLQLLASKLPNLFVLKLLETSTAKICALRFVSRIYVLESKKNKILRIRRNCFSSTTSLQMIYLSLNEIAVVEAHSFTDLPMLEVLDLAANPITKFSSSFLFNCSLSILLITLEDEIEVDELTDRNPNSSFVVTNDHHLCCLHSLFVFCIAEIPHNFSCSKLLPVNVAAAFIVVSTLVTALNLTSITCMVKESNQHLASVIKANSFSHLLLALHLDIIWISHASYKETFPFIEESWRSSKICFSAMATFLWFSLLAQCSLVLLSLLRLMVTVNPIDSKFKQANFVQKAVAVIFLVTFTSASALTTTLAIVAKVSPTVLCSPFLDPWEKQFLFQVILWLNFVQHLGSSTTVIVMSVMLVYQVNKSQKYVQPGKKSDPKTGLVFQLSLISLTNVACWTPSNTVQIIAMYIESFPLEVVMWTFVTILPLNSLIDPVIFTAGFLRKLVKAKLQKVRY